MNFLTEIELLSKDIDEISIETFFDEVSLLYPEETDKLKKKLDLFIKVGKEKKISIDFLGRTITSNNVTKKMLTIDELLVSCQIEKQLKTLVQSYLLFETKFQLIQAALLF